MVPTAPTWRCLDHCKSLHAVIVHEIIAHCLSLILGPPFNSLRSQHPSRKFSSCLRLPELISLSQKQIPDFPGTPSFQILDCAPVCWKLSATDAKNSTAFLSHSYLKKWKNKTKATFSLSQLNLTISEDWFQISSWSYCCCLSLMCFSFTMIFIFFIRPQ